MTRKLPPLVNSMSTELEISEFEQAAQKMVELGNRLLDDDEEADSWEAVSYTHLTLPTNREV